MNIRYCIRTCNARVKMASDLYDNLKKLVPQGTKIDIVNDYIGRKPIKIFGNYLKSLVNNNDFDLLVTLEDDAVLNDHIHTNIINMPILEELEDIGCVQLSLFSENDLREPTTQYDIDYDCFVRGNCLHYSCGLIFTKKMIEKLDIDMLQKSDNIDFDIALTKLCVDSGLLFVLHYPAIVATIPNVKSSLGNSLTPFDDLFSKTWNRLDTTSDEYMKVKVQLKRFLKLHKMLNS
jgi:hypothetical protein